MEPTIDNILDKIITVLENRNSDNDSETDYKKYKRKYRLWHLKNFRDFKASKLWCFHSSLVAYTQAHSFLTLAADIICDNLQDTLNLPSWL